jgi:hypothetical protein
MRKGRISGRAGLVTGRFSSASRAAELNAALLERTRQRGGLRRDVVVDDLSLILEAIAAIRLGGETRTRELRHRYLALFLAGLRADQPPLPGPAPTADELGRRWARRPDP